jgi:branched-chain amino acid transport system substrate-binding protein
VHSTYLYSVKKPADSKYYGDIYNVEATLPADEAFRPMSEGGCPLIASK